MLYVMIAVMAMTILVLMFSIYKEKKEDEMVKTLNIRETFICMRDDLKHMIGED